MHIAAAGTDFWIFKMKLKVANRLFVFLFPLGIFCFLVSFLYFYYFSETARGQQNDAFIFSLNVTGIWAITISILPRIATYLLNETSSWSEYYREKMKSPFAQLISIEELRDEN